MIGNQTPLLHGQGMNFSFETNTIFRLRIALGRIAGSGIKPQDEPLKRSMAVYMPVSNYIVYRIGVERAELKDKPREFSVNGDDLKWKH